MNSYENGCEKMRRAALAVCLDYPLYGSIMLRTEGVIADPECDTAWTDGKRIGFSPKLADQLTHYGCMFVIIHEIWHIMLKHMLRRGMREGQKWNVAADLVIHSNMKADGFKILKWALYEGKYDGMHTEKVYNLLPDQPGPLGNCGQGTPNGGESGTVSGEAPKDANGNPVPGSSIGEVRPMKNEDGSTMSEAEKSAEAREIDVAISQGINQQKACGKGTGGAERLVKDILDSKVSWETILRQYLEVYARDDYNFSMPSRRYICHGLYMPTLKSESMPDMAFIIDTSGSVSKLELQQFMSEVFAILSIFQVRVHVLYVDSAFKGYQEFNSKEMQNLAAFDPKGGGGTSFRPGFKYLEEQGIDPAVCVYLTDLDCNDFPDEAPDYDVVWCCINSFYKERKLPFGELVMVELT